MFIQGSTVYFGVYADGSEMCGNEHNSKCLEKTENSGIKENLKEIMNESSSGFPSCGTDAVRTGWEKFLVVKVHLVGVIVLNLIHQV